MLTLIYNIIQSIYMSVYQKPPHILLIEQCGNINDMNVIVLDIKILLKST